MTDQTGGVAATTTDTASAPVALRRRAWIMVMLGGSVAALIGIVALVVLVSTALDGSGRSNPNLWLAVMAIGVVVGGLLASLGFRYLGVRRGWRTALLGALVGVTGVLSPWVLAFVIGRVTS